MAEFTVPVTERDHIQGNPNAPVTLLEYGDYECPYCGAAYPNVKLVQQRMGERLRFVFRNFPLAQIHPHAEHAAEAAEAAGEQGKFWEMHDTLYEHQSALDDIDLIQYAADLDLDIPRFEEGLTTHTYAARVREDFLSGIRSGVNGTPTFFINGRRHDGSYDAETLQSALEAAIEHGGVKRA
ncbi:MAG TPA: thioredoxin domain-containing protein [Ktedonobacterales bacterium]|nr:thioredoxin domain-containing protein [Ktedonobacterales bacterium]